MNSLSTTTLILVLADTAAALVMAGIIWAVQIVQYPLMARVGSEQWRDYHEAHCQKILYVVAPPMLVGPLAAGRLAFTSLPLVPSWLLWSGFACAILAWVVTIAVSAPLHGRLSNGRDATAHRALTQTNWLRTVLWNAHALLVLAMLYSLLRR